MSREEAGKKEEKSESEAEREEMSFEEVKDFFAENGHLPEPEEYNPTNLYENFDEYKNEVNRKQDTWTGADIDFFAKFKDALRESYEIEKGIKVED